MNNYFLLPSITGPGIEELERELAKKLLPNYLELKSLDKTNKGNRIAIMVSPVNGFGEYDSTEHDSHLKTAEQIKLRFEGNSLLRIFRRNVELFNWASSNDLRKVIQDEDFAHIFVIGHASYHSWVASNKSLNWYGLGQMVDGHLKNGIFANVRCGGIYSWNMIPLGYFVVANHKTLIGYEAENAYSDKLGAISKLKPLRRMPKISTLD